MKLARPLCYAIAWLAVGGLCLPVQLIADDGSARHPGVEEAQITDVALGSDGLLVGQLLDASRVPRTAADVAVWADGRPIATTRTDANGTFAVAGLRGGIHQISTADSSRIYRFWATGTAPPGAADSAQIVAGQEVVIRGQWEGPGSMAHQLAMWGTNPFLVGGVIAAAVAVPVILNNTDDDDGPNS